MFCTLVVMRAMRLNGNHRHVFLPPNLGDLLVDHNREILSFIVRRLGLANQYVPVVMHLLIPIWICHCPEGIEG